MQKGKEQVFDINSLREDASARGRKATAERSKSGDKRI